MSCDKNISQYFEHQKDWPILYVITDVTVDNEQLQVRSTTTMNEMKEFLKDQTFIRCTYTIPFFAKNYKKWKNS
jgi:hypothetical protein